ncbi:MAG TPA: hypothetical protein VFB00_06490 [Terriglobales bacterium]|nr:hypothetical protein [Terriglobales bacterium]
MRAWKRWSLCLAVLIAGTSAPVRAQVTLLLEEPYSYDGTFAGTGHTAVYLSRVCAASPFQLRRCESGEQGVVISRYHGIAGHDWMAVPLIPYLYAVARAEDIPLFADAKLVAFLRKNYLGTLALPPEKKPGDEPRYELAGSAYDRTLYGFRIATRPEQDDELIRILNSSPNVESYKLLKRNCADFVKQIINFYYPHAIHRSVIADLGVTTPKQAAKSLVHSSKHHPEMQLTRFIIPQVPGQKRSKPVHGVLESLVLAKKYVTPVLLFHPVLVGTVEVSYWAGWRFNPAKGAMILDPNSPEPFNTPEPPLTAVERRQFEQMVSRARSAAAEAGSLPSWRKLQGGAEPGLDAAGHPVLRMTFEGRDVQVGLSRSNVLRLASPPELVEDLLLTRLEAELKPGKPMKTSESMLDTDWKLLQSTASARRESLSAKR